MGSLFPAAVVTGAGVMPGPAAPVTSAAPVACLSTSVPTLGMVTPTSAASATGSPSRHECTRESSHPERRRRRSSGREMSRSGGKRGKGQSPSPARFARSLRVSAPSSSQSSDAEEKVSAMPPPHAGRGGCSKCDCSESDCDRSTQPGPSGLDSGARSATGANWSRSEYGGQSSPTPSGAADDDRSRTFVSVDMDKGDSFRSVLRLFRNFHSLEEPASVAPNQCETSLAPVYGLQSESSRLFTCLFPLTIVTP